MKRRVESNIRPALARMLSSISFGGPLRRKGAFPTLLLLSAVQIWGQTPMKMPTPSLDIAVATPAPVATPEMAQMTAQKMGDPGLVPPGMMVGMAKRWMIDYQLIDKMDGNRTVASFSILHKTFRFKLIAPLSSPRLLPQLDSKGFC